MMQRQRFTPRDEVYLSSTGFEVYMASGAVFVLGFTLAFLFSFWANIAWALWPGMFVAVVAAYLTLNRLERREQRRKLALLEAEYAKHNGPAPGTH